MKQPRVRLSQCMIVKNEEKNIEQALSWGRGFVYEQIVVDTGSTDRTVEIAERLGAKVFHFEWVDDFSAAKNYAISQAKGDWIAFLDADEYFTESEAAKVMPLLKEIDGDQRIDLVRARWVQLDDHGQAISASCQDRIFRNRKGLRYRYRIHEGLFDPAKKLLGCFDVQDRLAIMHTGYADEAYRDTQKGKRNIELLEKSLKEHPKDAMLLTYLGDACYVDGQVDRALQCYRRVLDDPDLEMTDETAYPRAAFQLMTHFYNQNDLLAGEEIARLCSALEENGWGFHPDIDYFRGLWHLKCGEYAKAERLLESALGKLEQYEGREDARVAGAIDQTCLQIAAICLEQTGNPHKAVQYAVTVLQMDKYVDKALLILMKAFAAELGGGADVEPYWQFLSKVFDYGNAKDLLHLYKCAKLCGFSKMEDRILQRMPQELRAAIK